MLKLDRAAAGVAGFSRQWVRYSQFSGSRIPQGGFSVGGFISPHFVAVTGLAFEARIVAGPGVTVICGGGKAQLRRSLELAVRHECHGILSFGIAGGLAPHLKPGSCIVARTIITDHGRYMSDHVWAQSLMDMMQSSTPRRFAPPDVSFGDIAGSDVPLASAHAKRKLHERTGAIAVDMESHVAARIANEHRVPFAAFRVVTDPSDRALPPAALVATTAAGAIDFQAIIRSLIRHPKQVPTLFRLALDSWAARQSLVPGRRFLGPNLGLPDLRQHLLDVA
jgi:adenosylhomocysteine nucleosidase